MTRNLVLALTFGSLALLTITTSARAQYGTLLTGTFTQGNAATCQTGGWYFYTDPHGMITYLNCYDATVSGCPSADDWGLTYGYLDPKVVGLVQQDLGVIVMLSGHGGTACR